MNTPFIAQLKTHLPEQSWPWVLAALRQDKLVWETLNTCGSILQVPSDLDKQPESWNPARIAFLTLGQPVPTPNGTLSLGIRQRAFRTYETLTQRQQPTLDNLPPMIRATLLAVALRERLRLTGKWDNLVEELKLAPFEVWTTPLACLYGLVEKPDDLLHTLIVPGVPVEIFHLAIHALLSNPLPSNEQINLLQSMVAKLPVSDLYVVLRHLTAIRPQLAADFAKRISVTKQTGDDEIPLYRLVENYRRAEIALIAGYRSEALETISTAKDQARIVQANLAAQNAQVCDDPIISWQKAYEYAPERPEYRARLALAFLDARNVTDASSILDPTENNGHPDLLFATARLAYLSGDIDNAKQLASQALFASEAQDNQVQKNPVILPRLTIQLARLLMELSLYSAAIRAIQLTLHEQPNDPELLILLGQAQSAAGQHMQAAESYQWAAILAPDRPDLHRDLAESLESAGEWGLALEERKIMAATTASNSEDQYTLADCALHNKQPEYAAEISRAILVKNPSDGIAHTLLGEALSAQGDLESAREHFSQASELAPYLPRPWLALARAYNQSDHPLKALETLRIAAQALPASAEVHLALGEQYQSTNSPTQALSAFERAAEIEPGNEIIALRYGQTLYQLGHLPQAHQVLAQAYQKDPANVEVAHIYAQILLVQDDAQAAVTPLETVVASNPNDPTPFVDYARALLMTKGDATKATKALEHALHLNPNYIEAQALLGEALAAEGDYQRALEAFQTALETPLAQNNDWHSRLSYGLGNVALKLGQTGTAIASLLEATHLDPQNYRPVCLLADAYESAGLIPDSYQSAREALRLAGDDLPVMVWFVEKILALSVEGQTGENGSIQPNPRQDELRQTAMQTLARAAELTSTQADILLRIAHIQATAGDPDSAIINYRKLVNVLSASPAELQEAACALLNLNDANGAVLCFKKALDNIPGKSGNKELETSLLTQLAHSLQKERELEAALETIEKAIHLAPDDATLSVYKAQLLIEAGQSQSALSFLEEELKRLPNPKLHHITAIILQTQGKLLEALKHSNEGAQAPTAEENQADGIGQQLSVIVSIELARTLLMPDQACHVISNQSVFISGRGVPAHPLYQILCAEIALEDEREIEAAQLLGKALENADNKSPRLLALQARIMARRGDHQSALEIYQSALQTLGEGDAINAGSTNQVDEKSVHRMDISSSPVAYQSNLYPFIDTALELNLWGVALRLAQKAVLIAPAEPLAHLNLARVLVKRAEFQLLCDDSEVVHHAPGLVALSEGTCHTYDQAIQDVFSICGNLSLHTNLTAVPTCLARWQFRGNAVFTPSEATAQALDAWANKSLNHEDIASSISALRHVESNAGYKIKDYSQQTGIVLTQIALSLQDKVPQEAIKALQLAILNEPIHSIYYGIRHFLLARMAFYHNQPIAAPAIQSALTLIPDEPRWCALAAKINLASGNKEIAINYLEQAIQLEPRAIEHLLALGNLYLQFTEEGKSSDALLAVKCLERATRITPDNANAWLTLARAHRLAGSLEQAAAAAERSTTLAPDITASYLIEAEIALQAGKPQAAHDHALAALQIQPGSIDAAMALSRTLQALNRPAEALAVIDKAIPAPEQSLPLKLERIHLIRKSQGPGTALQAVTELSQNYPDDSTVLAMLAEVQADAGQEEIAIRTAQKAILLGESLSTAQQMNLRLLLGQLLRRAGQLDQAVHHLDEVIQLSPEKIEAYLELGRTHQDRRQLAQALLMYRRAATIAPRDPRSYLQAGLALKEGKDYVEAETMLRRAAELAPNDPTIRRQLAAVIAINLVHNPRHTLQAETV